MKLKQCDRFKNHYFDGDKYQSCPQCEALGLGKSDAVAAATPSVTTETDDVKTVQLTQMLVEEPEHEQHEPVEASDVSLSGSVDDLKTMAMYDFEDEIEPVAGWLVIFEGEEKGKSFELHVGKNQIGRSGGEPLDISLDADKKVSRGAQAIIIYDPKNVKYLLQPTNGSSLVYLNGELLMLFSEIKAYDRIIIGDTELIFVPFCTEEVQW